MTAELRVLELYSGIGGMHYALKGRCRCMRHVVDRVKVAVKRLREVSNYYDLLF